MGAQAAPAVSRLRALATVANLVYMFQKQVPLQLRQVPKGEVFQPPRRYLKHLEPMDFLGKAKVKHQGVFQLRGPAART